MTNRSVTGSTMPVSSSQVKPAGFHYLLIFKLFSVFVP